MHGTRAFAPELAGVGVAADDLEVTVVVAVAVFFVLPDIVYVCFYFYSM